MGHFFLGFAIGAAIGAAVVVLGGTSGELDQRGERMGLRAPAKQVRSRLADALEAGRSAASAREQELLAEFRSRIARSSQATSTQDIFRSGV